MANAHYEEGQTPSGSAAEVARATSLPLDEELRSAQQDFERGDYIDLTDEQLERCIVTGESPWPGESHG